MLNETGAHRQFWVFAAVPDICAQSLLIRFRVRIFFTGFTVAFVNFVDLLLLAYS